MSTQTASRVGTFVWHENVSTDPKRAQEFYTQLFGWEIEVFKADEFEYPVGRVVKGLDVVERIGKLGDQSEQPTAVVEILRFRVSAG